MKSLLILYGLLIITEGSFLPRELVATAYTNLRPRNVKIPKIKAVESYKKNDFDLAAAKIVVVGRIFVLQRQIFSPIFTAFYIFPNHVVQEVESEPWCPRFLRAIEDTLDLFENQLHPQNKEYGYGVIYLIQKISRYGVR